jgi:calcineurin-like phosphoesterase family protein
MDFRPTDHPERAQAEHRLNVQMDILENYKGAPYFISGNHDWGGDGLKGIKRQEEYVENYLNNEDVWFPENGCGGPSIVEVNKDLVILLIDSGWWLTDWDKEPEINDGCESKSRKNFLYQFEEAVKKYRNRNIVIAMHHPLYTNGPHGGYFPADRHLFPLKELNEQLWVPLPGIGTAYVILRSTLGIREDLAYHPYKELKDGLMATVNKNGSFIFVAGHEHSLQYFAEEDQHFIVSGAGSKRSPIRSGKGSEFTYGGEGISILNFYEDGTTWLEFWRPSEERAEGELIYKKKIKGTLPIKKIEKVEKFDEYEELKDSVTFVLHDERHKKSGFHRFWFGDLYREEYMTPVKVPTFDVPQFRGGLKPIKRGGGYQTNSLRLLDSVGHQYVMRALQKDASRTVPYPFNKTFVRDVFADQFASAHPYSAYAVPKLAEAARVYHTNPILFYTPKQPALEQYNDRFGKELYLVEERPDEKWSDLESMGFPDDVTNTYKVSKELREDHDHRLDQNYIVRARLLDNVIGDWDRHDDQWRWAEFKEDGDKIYRPIPRDRDQVFSNYDGAIMGVLRLSIPFLKQLRLYEEGMPNVKWTNYHARHFDRSFLNEPDWEDWKKAALEMQAAMTDEVIESAVREIPPEVFSLKGEKIIRILKSRRDILPELARELYLHVSNKVDVVGTDKKDFFEVIRQDDERTIVRHYDPSDEDKRNKLVFERTFLRGETKEVILYGLGNEDEFEISGDVNHGILIRCVGGLDEDRFQDNSSVRGPRKMTHFYDSKTDNELEKGSEAADKTSRHREFNLYNRRAQHYEYDYSMPLPVLGFQPDDGVYAGLGYQFVSYGFQRVPYSSRHTIKGRFAFATSAYAFNYDGEFISRLGKWDILLSGRFQGPNFTMNFFGLGNETDNPEKDNFDFNRVRQQTYEIAPGLRLPVGGSGFFTILANAQMTQIEKTAGRFISQSETIRPEVFDNQFFGGLEMGYELENFNDPVIPSRGAAFGFTTGYRLNLENTDRRFGYLRSHFTWYIDLIGKNRLVFATRVGYQQVFGDQDFFQSPTLGGSDNLRGFRQHRFTGDAVFFHNLDLRLRLFTLESYVFPFSLGVYGGYDYGRVWLEGAVDSDVWHKGYGGGIWLAPFDAAVISAGLFYSDEGNRLEIKGGFQF